VHYLGGGKKKRKGKRWAGKVSDPPAQKWVSMSTGRRKGEKVQAIDQSAAVGEGQ